MEDQGIYGLLLVIVAVAVGVPAFFGLRLLLTWRDRMLRVANAVHASLEPAASLAGTASGADELDRLAHHDTRPDLQTKLLRAGFAGAGALRRFWLLRAVTSLSAPVLVVWGLLAVGVGQIAGIALLAVIAAAVVYLAAGIVVERLATVNERQFRKMFPDFLDLLIVCVDAGLGVEAAVARVAEEFTQNQSLFGQYVWLMALELRAGRQIDEVFQNFSKRTGVTQANDLAVLFRQSQDLGTSIITSLRAFSHQMRQMRMIRAEENANQLPVRMLLPLAGFLFPVNLIIVLLPVMIRILSMFVNLAPGGAP